jgi:hypothetical protein
MLKRMTGTGCNFLLFEDYATCNNALEVCTSHPAHQVDRQLNWRGGRGNFRKQGNIFGHTQKTSNSQYDIENDIIIMCKNLKLLLIIWCLHAMNEMQL